MSFGILCNGKWFTRESFFSPSKKVVKNSDGSTEVVTTYTDKEIIVYYHVKRYLDVEESWLIIENISNHTINIERVDTIFDEVNLNHKKITYFESAWGNEYQPIKKKITDTIILESRLGRSSASIHPFVLLEDEEDLTLLTVAWSGNWILRFEPSHDALNISGGLSDWQFSKLLLPKKQMESVHVLQTATKTKDINVVSNQLSRFGTDIWYPKTDQLKQPLVEWNHWWTYEDVDINEEVFKDNINIAKEIGIDVCTLDAGWFGPSNKNTEWFDWRGDWELVNKERFPSGIKHLSAYVHEKGMKFGFWCEIEGLGKHAKIRGKLPSLPAKRDGKDLGYVCFGNPEAQRWAFTVLDKIITNYQCDWIKLDFNLNPEAGCNRIDHGHDAGDGLYEHYQGYYSVLNRIREKHPDIILENCSSGGLRTDLGIMKHTHLNFLSDPDYSLHKFQVFWAATILLAPSNALHWIWSKSRVNDEGGYPFPPLDLEECTKKQLDFHMRAGMLHRFGFSHPLSNYSDQVVQKLNLYIRFYKEIVHPFIMNGDLYRLTGQTINSGIDGDLWSAYQYVLSDQGKSIIFSFCMDEINLERNLLLHGLNHDNNYIVKDSDSNEVGMYSGKVLMEQGITIKATEKWESHILLVELEN
ncbi:alpha-galactosidase [Lederbergia citrea]|uniref:alpha-galactosidase n=1 Tax=Lederbergia citrea TaxID=2833581 RepID=A0A942UR11_9BACI|nr:alpha-galactosidase [Lederbergia citrea]MBS4204007.1 alpha-galactosidase [Lederbergia citrea]MBS4221409.1 alpha-galactosidase [Lederbergia citrea]